MHLKASFAQRAKTILLAAALPIVLLVFLMQRASATPLIVLGLAFMGVFAISRTYGRLATEFSMLDRNTLECKTLFGKVLLPVSTIESIDGRPWKRGMIDIKSANTCVYFYRNMPGALEAMREIAAMNSSIKLRQ